MNPFSGTQEPVPQIWKGHSLTEILAVEYREVKALIRPFFYEQSGTLLSAHPHSLKSLASLQMMIEAPLRKKVFQQFEVNGIKRTLYIETEDPPPLVQNRVHQICKGLGVTPNEAEESGFQLRMPGAFDLVKDASILYRVIEESKPDVMVLSTEQGLLGGRDFSQQSEMFDVNKICVHIARFCCPLMLLTHSPQDPRQKRAAGTVTRAANYPTLIHFEKKVNNCGTVVKVNLDSKFDSVSEFALQLEVGAHSLRVVYEPENESESPRRRDIERYISEHRGMDAKEIAAKLRCDPSYVRRIRRELGKRVN